MYIYAYVHIYIKTNLELHESAATNLQTKKFIHKKLSSSGLTEAKCHGKNKSRGK